MTNNWTLPVGSDSVFVESDDAKTLRESRVWRFVGVMWVTWLFYAAYLSLRAYPAAAAICIAVTIAMAAMNALTYRRSSVRRVMHANLLLSAVGLFGVAASDYALQCTMLFYPIAIIVTSQLSGTREAFKWYLITMAAYLLYHLTVIGVELTLDPLLDQLILVQGVAACTFFCCHQGEDYYNKRTNALISLSADLKSQHTHLKYLATTDPLTGLMNRFQFQLQLQQAIKKSVKHSVRSVLFVIDLNGFKEVNDTLGHPVGDELLKQIGGRLGADFGSEYQVARLGGDEFCVIADNGMTGSEAEAVAAAIVKALNYRYRNGDIEFLLSASVGFCICPDQATDENDMFSFADTAMFYAKENQLGYAKYERTMTDRMIEHRKLQGKLADALDRGEFFLVYQPQVNLTTGKVSGVEALLRWQSDGELISPVRFVPVLERGGEIRRVGSWVIREACKQWANWRDAGMITNVSINVSAVQFKDESFLQAIENAIEEFHVDPQHLDFEITEGLLIDDVGEAATKLHQIKRLGSTISVDDFGTGYSSLAYLRQFPIDRLKIDRAFVKDFPEADDGIIASSIIALAKTLDLRVLAEGVELPEQLQFLKIHDCDEYQGYLYSRPVSADEIAGMLPRMQQDRVDSRFEAWGDTDGLEERTGNNGC